MKKIISSALAVLFACSNLIAQETKKELNSQDLIDIEELYKSTAPPPAVKLKPESEKVELTEQEKKEFQSIQNDSEYRDSKLKSISELNNLSPFSDVSMIQKKFLPKTERFQVFTALGLSTNSPWFLNLGAKVNMSYNFSEDWGLEFSGMFLGSSEKDSAKEIRENNSLQPEIFILTKSYLGIGVLWSPIYGKIAKLNREIIPFDMYFSFGGGISNTNSVEKNVATGQISTGQIFAISKSMAFRWDYAWMIYQATPVASVGSSNPAQKSTYNDLVFTAGVSFFFPEVKYR